MRLVFTLLACLIATTAVAQEQDEQDREPDFLFGAPRGYFGIRGGWHAASSSGEIYDFLEEFLTIERSSYDTLVFGGEVGLAIASRIDVVVGFDFSQAKIDSEFREFEDPAGRPIEQQTILNIVPLTASVKLYLSERGRAVSTYAYVPAKVRPYVGAGGGAVFYKLQITGELVDADDQSIFEANLDSSVCSDSSRTCSIAGLGGHVFAGVDTRLTERFSLAIEGRYLWANAGLGGSFEDPEEPLDIDLSGLRITAALNIAF